MKKILLISALLMSASAFAQEMPTPGSSVDPMGQNQNREERRAKFEQWCQNNQQACEEKKEERAKRRAYCEANPGSCPKHEHQGQPQVD